MLPGPEQVLQCPNCAAAVLQPTTSSGNTLDAVYYTDGYMDAPMMPQPAALEGEFPEDVALVAERIRERVAARSRCVAEVFAGEDRVTAVPQA